jgi:prepilin-type N-terminal cleavage/methylation domain-containing protein
MRTTASQKGFTIVELMIASTILTVLLVSASFVLVQIGRLYYKGVITSRTQDTARNIIESISRPAQLEGAKITDVVSGEWRVICVGNQRFSIRENKIATSADPFVALKDYVATSDQCNVAATASSAGVESLLANNMRIASLGISEADGMRQVSVTVAYGEIDDFEPIDTAIVPVPQPTCLQQASSSQWCAVASYSTRVFPRIGQQ